MASTQVTLFNYAGQQVLAELHWGATIISTVNIDNNDSGVLPAEWVWYDLYVYTADSSKTELASITGIYGDSTMEVDTTTQGKYVIVPH